MMNGVSNGGGRDRMRDRLEHPNDNDDVIAVFNDGREVRMKYGHLPTGYEWRSILEVGDTIGRFFQGPRSKDYTAELEPSDPAHRVERMLRDKDPIEQEKILRRFLEETEPDTLCVHGLNAHGGESCPERDRPVDELCEHGFAQDMACEECGRSGFRFPGWNDEVDFGESEAEKNSPHSTGCAARHGADCDCGAWDIETRRKKTQALFDYESEIGLDSED